MIQYSKLDSPMSPHSFLGVLFKRRKLVLVLFTVIVASIVGSTFLMPKVYKASTQVIVKYLPTQGGMYLSENMTTQSVKPNYELLETEVRLVHNWNILRTVVKHFGLDKPEDLQELDENGIMQFQDKVVYEFGQKLKVEREKDTNILTISFEDENPRFAANVVDKIAEEYMRQRPDWDRDERAYKFFDDELKQIEQRIDAIELASKNIKRRSNVLIPAEQTEILFNKLANFDEELTKVRADRIAKEARLKSIERALEHGDELYVPITETTESLAKEDYLNHMRKNLADKKVHNQALKTKYTDQHPEVQQIVQEIAELEIRIKLEIHDVVRSEKMLVETLKAQEAALAQSMEMVAKEINDLATTEYELTKSSFNLEDLQHVKSTLIRQREQARIAGNRGENAAQVRLVQAAMVPFVPEKPNKPLYAALALLLGSVISIGFAFFLEYFDHSVNTAEDAQNCLGLPILAQIKDFEGKKGNAAEKSESSKKLFDDVLTTQN